MEVIIGLGGAGCRIADEFAKYPQYDCFKIDEGRITGPISRRGFSVAKQKDHEAYEANAPNLLDFFDDIEKDILFVIGGSGTISGMSLAIMEQIHKLPFFKSISVLYIEPNLSLLAGVKKLQERATFYVLQEYARSGLIKRLFLVSNVQIENILGDVPIIGYNERLNQMIVSTIHMCNVYENVESIVDNFMDFKEHTRISTIGISNLENEGNMFFPLDNIKEMRYYFAINREKLETDGTLMRRVTENVVANDSIDTSYGVFATEYPDDYIYFLANTSMIQYRENEKKALQL